MGTRHFTKLKSNLNKGRCTLNCYGTIWGRYTIKQRSKVIYPLLDRM